MKNETKNESEMKMKTKKEKTGILIKLCVLGVIAAIAMLGGCIGGEKEKPAGNDTLGGDVDAHGCIGSAGYSWCELKQKCLRTFEEKCENETIVGGDRDEHGCIGSAGYSWCELKQKCLRTFEEKCENETIVGGDGDEHGCIGSAGYSWCEVKQKCIRPWEEDCTEAVMSEDLCRSAGGNWNECSSRCQLDNQGKQGVACTMQCEALCECAGIAGFRCPEGYACKMPEGVADALGYCVKETAGQKACTEEAKVCPDGTAVGRVGPDCEFAPCPGEAMAIADALKIAKKSNNPYIISDSHNTLGAYYTIISDFYTSIKYHEKALSIRLKLKDKLAIMKSYNNLGSAKKEIGNHQEEIDYYFKALNITEELKDTISQTKIEMNIADALIRQQQFEEAEKYFIHALELLQILGDVNGQISCYIGLGNLHHNTGKFNRSIEYFIKVEK